MIQKTHIWRNRLIILLASLLIMLALMFGVLRLLLPHVTSYGDNIRSQLVKQLGVPVSIQTVNAEIWWLSPRLKLSGVNIYDPDGIRHVLHVDEILVGFDWMASLRQQSLQLGFIAFNGAYLQIRRFADGRWQIQDVMLPAPSQGALLIPPEIQNLLQDTSIYLHDIQLDWQDEQRNNQHLLVKELNITLLNDAPRHQLSVDLDLPPAYGGHVQLLVDITGPIDQPAQWQGQLYAAVNRLQLKPWFNDYWQLFDFVADGQLDANVWIDWQQLKVQQIHAVVSGERLALHYLNNSVQSWKLDQLIGNMRWQQNSHGWRADVSGLELQRNQLHWRQPTALSLEMDTQQRQLNLNASYLQVDGLSYLAGLVNSFLPQDVDADWNTPLQAWHIHGELFDVDLKLPLDQPELLGFSSRFSDMGYSSQLENLPSVSGLDGRLAYQNQQARIQLDSRNVTLDFKDLFRQPLTLQSMTTDLFVSHNASQTQIYAADITATSPHINTHSRLHIVADKDAPVFMDLVSTYDHGQGAHTGYYLPTAIMGKDTVHWLDKSLINADVSGGFLFYGRLQDMPFSSNQGVMQVQFNVTNGQLDYLPDWPVITHLSARVRFRNNAMFIDQGSGHILGAALTNTSVEIDDLTEAHLVIKGDVAAPLPEMIRFVSESPLKGPLSFVSKLQTSGDATLGLDLQIPLGSEDDVKVNGRLALTGNELFLPEQGYRFKGVNGSLRFTESSLESDRLRASLDDFPLALRIEPLQIAGIAHSRITADGYAPLASLLAPLPDWQNKVSGSSNWQMTLDIPMQTRPDGVELAIAASGEMQGVASQMPLFLARSATQPGQMRFGLDVLQNGNMNIRAALAGSYEVSAERREQRWNITADSAMLRGRASFMEDFQLDEWLTVDLEHLDLAALQASRPDSAAEVKDAPDETLLPGKIPPLRVRIAQLNWNDVALRDVELQTHRSNDGMEIDALKFSGPHLTVEGRGSWQTAWRVPHTTRLDFTVRSDNLGAALAEMGRTQSLENTTGEAVFRWRWQDAPQNFDWSRLTGDAELHLQDGRLQHIEAGAGRLIGLLNFRTLLSLDFGEQVREGFAFDEINAHYTFRNGNVYSDDFKLESKVAVINMQGRIGMVKEDYDQTITVVPVVGNTLTLIGTVAGGPVTGVLVHVFQKLLHVDRIARYKYTVSGSWDKPMVKLIDAPQTANTENAENNENDSL